MTWKQVLPELARLDDPATHELFSQAYTLFGIKSCSSKPSS